MSTWEQPGGFYPGGQQGPPPPGFFPPPTGGYPQQPGYAPPYPQQPGYPGPGFPPGGFPAPKPEFVGGYAGGGGFGPSPPMSGGGYNDFGGEGGTMGNTFDAFSEKTVRLGFIRKVYGILMCQLLLTLSVIALFTFHDPTKMYVRTHPGLWWVSMGVMFATLITMACCGDVRRKAPMNFIFLGLFTLAESFLLGCATSTFRQNEVLLAVGICAVVTLGLTLFAFQTKIDFTVMGGILFVAVLILMIFGIVAMFWPGKTITLVYASFGALLFSIYIVYDTQLMMGGSHKYSISPEEYIFAALNLYVDIVNLFLYILTIIGASRD